MKKTILAFFIGLVSSSNLYTQENIVVEITALPAGHVEGSAIYIAGSFNGWNPKDEKFRFDANNRITLSLEKGRYEYKITRGSWDKVECKKNGTGIPNRTLNVEGSETVKIEVEEWQDKFPAKPKTSTASARVKVIDTAFWIPQLNRSRRVWIYLPEDYHNSKTRYPVLYMHDGQNVFEDSSSFSGEWGIDEFLDSSHLRKSIVVAVDHGAQKRLNEYNPFDNTRFGKGEGDAYLEFLVKKLKPFIEKNYRASKKKKENYISGSSMGGLISMYALLKYPKVFGGAGLFSPAFWVGPEIYNTIDKRGKKVKANIYFYAGKQEGEQMVPDMLRAFEKMLKVSKSKMKIQIRDEGKHNEADWRREFPEGYRWMVEGSY